MPLAPASSLQLRLLLLPPSPGARSGLQEASGRASPSSSSPSSRSLAANFPEPRPAARSSPRQLRGPRADLGRRAWGCPLSHPKPSECSGENRTMSRAGDRGKTLARWLGTGLLGKAAPALSFLTPLAYPHPTLKEGTLEKRGALDKVAPNEWMTVFLLDA